MNATGGPCTQQTLKDWRGAWCYAKTSPRTCIQHSGDVSRIRRKIKAYEYLIVGFLIFRPSTSKQYSSPRVDCTAISAAVDGCRTMQQSIIVRRLQLYDSISIRSRSRIGNSRFSEVLRTCAAGAVERESNRVESKPIVGHAVCSHCDRGCVGGVTYLIFTARHSGGTGLIYGWLAGDLLTGCDWSG